MTEYEKAIFEYGIAYGRYVRDKQDVFAVSYYEYIDRPFKSMRESYVINRLNDSGYINNIQEAWNARCKVMKLRKELNNDKT